MGRKAVGPVCCVMHVKEPRTLIVKEKGLAPVFLDSCLEHPTGIVQSVYCKCLKGLCNLVTKLFYFLPYTDVFIKHCILTAFHMCLLGLGGSTIFGTGSVPKEKLGSESETGSKRFKEKRKD